MDIDVFKNLPKLKHRQEAGKVSLLRGRLRLSSSAARGTVVIGRARGRQAMSLTSFASLPLALSSLRAGMDFCGTLTDKAQC